ncbi:MAG TPA: nuclear transport factor 2 family protein [Conexibacter sp.]
MDEMRERTNGLRALYRAFNEREIDAVLAAFAADVDWPNGWEGGRVVGHEAVRDYWTRQWAAIDPSVEPEEIVERPDGTIAVSVHQVIRDPDGRQLADSRVCHVYTFDGDLVTRMEIEGE